MEVEVEVGFSDYHLLSLHSITTRPVCGFRLCFQRWCLILTVYCGLQLTNQG